MDLALRKAPITPEVRSSRFLRHVSVSEHLPVTTVLFSLHRVIGLKTGFGQGRRSSQRTQLLGHVVGHAP